MTPQVRTAAIKAARKYGIPPALFLALIRQESGGNPNARSPAGAIGLTQLMPQTAKGLGVDPTNWRQNLEGGARYLSQQYRKFGRWDLALSAYNSGPGGAESSGKVEGFRETQNYVKRVMGMAGDLKGAPGPATFLGAQAAPTATPMGGRSDRAAALMKLNKIVGLPTPPDFAKLLQARAPKMGQGAVAPQVPMTSARAPKGRVNMMLTAIRKAQSMGLRVAENPFVEPVDPVHTKGSHHYQVIGRRNGREVGAAIDVSGDPAKLMAFFRWAEQYAGRGLNDLFHDPAGYSYDRGRRWNKTIGGHDGHVHFSV